jgi:hypothetical protein
MNFIHTHKDTLNKIFNIYFTTFPYQLYNYSNQVSNFALLGISHKLINAQTTFWITNACSIIIIYNIKNVDFIYYNISLSVWCFYLYINTSYSLINTIKYI